MSMRLALRGQRRPARWRVCVALVVLGVCCLAIHGVTAQAQPTALSGRLLSEALKGLQAEGMRLVFSSEVVTDRMHVHSEPHGATAKERLLALLEPHGLDAVDGPGGVLQIVRARSTRMPSRPLQRSRAAGAISGVALDAATDAPVAGALAELVRETGSERADAAGRFVFAAVAPGTHIVQVSGPAHTAQSYSVDVSDGGTVALTARLPRAVTYREQVTVHSPALGRSHGPSAVPAELDRHDLWKARPVIADDPVRAMHAVPGVGATDDFRSEFSVRGSPYRHLGIVVDGVATPWLQHTAHGRSHSGSMSMVGGGVLDSVTLQMGARPQKDGGSLGAQLDLVVREGSRERFRGRATFGGANAGLVAEGPLGRPGRGSWLVATRHSYLDWPIRPFGELSGTVFSFADGLAKVVYDLSPTQQASVTLLGGRSRIDESDDRLPDELGRGTNRATAVTVGWRSIVGDRTAVTQRVSVVGHRFQNMTRAGAVAGEGQHQQVMYRADIVRDLGAVLLADNVVLEAGGQLQRFQTLSSTDSTSGLGSGYASVSWRLPASLTVSPGVRVARSTLAARPAVSPWVVADWEIRSSWRLSGGAGVAHQFPEVSAPAAANLRELKPESATHVDLGLEHRLSESLSWRVTAYAREERDVLQPTDGDRVVVGLPLALAWHGRLENALAGSARGVEIQLERHRETGLSGRVAYAFGRMRYIDTNRGETFWGDFDQRHAVTLTGIYQPTDDMSLAVFFRSSTNFPIPGYLAFRGDTFHLGEQRNQTRLPAYARLDIRLGRSFGRDGRRITLFAEVLNALNHTNYAVGSGALDAPTGRVTSLLSELSRRRPSAGVSVEF